MAKFLMDNNVISNYFSNLFSPKGMTFVADVIDTIPNVSVITEIEALSWTSKDKNKEKIMRQFINDATIVGLSKEVVHQCITIRRNHKIKTPDAIIAATAMVHKYTLLTSDVDFKNIRGLKVIDPFSL